MTNERRAPVTVAFPTLIISRRQRQIGSGWDAAPSWFGGEPRLGDRPWPRGGPRRTPYHFLAQIDLAEVAREVARSGGAPPPLPDGALAFFMGAGGEGNDSPVVHVPRTELGGPTAPPPDAPAAFEPWGAIFPETFGPEAPRLFPRWPVDVTSIGFDPEFPPEAHEADVLEAIWAAQDAAVGQLFPRRPYFFAASEAYKLVGEGVRRYWWHSAHHYAACLRAALRHLPGRVEGWRQRLGAAGATRVAELERNAAEFEIFAREVADWARGTDPWRLMPPEAVARLKEAFERGKKGFADFTRYYAPHSLDDLETETLLALATADDRAYAMMPEPVRELINARSLLPAGGWHQMFGQGVVIQTNAALENEGNVMLLQLVYDDMMQWRFGDMGAFQFWIPPDDLARGNWAAVRVTFEMG